MVDQVAPGAPFRQSSLHGQDVFFPGVSETSPESWSGLELSTKNFFRGSQGLSGLLKHFPPDIWISQSGAQTLGESSASAQGASGNRDYRQSFILSSLRQVSNPVYPDLRDLNRTAVRTRAGAHSTVPNA